MKNKTFAVWLTLLLGPLGAHRLYLKGKFDSIAVVLFIASAAGMYGVLRARVNGVDDQISWLFIPWVGLAIAACALTAIVYGLMDMEKWNRQYNPDASPETLAGQSNWFTVFGLAAALFVGATALLASIAFTFQHYFEYQADQAVTSARAGNVVSSASKNKVNSTDKA
jgi:TM2 domain-containing membrane protein YozV